MVLHGSALRGRARVIITVRNVLLLVHALLALAACAPERGVVILATTTSTDNSGLLDVLVPMFQEQTGYTVKVIAAGSGAALRMGERGDADGGVGIDKPAGLVEDRLHGGPGVAVVEAFAREDYRHGGPARQHFRRLDPARACRCGRQRARQAGASAGARGDGRRLHLGCQRRALVSRAAELRPHFRAVSN